MRILANDEIGKVDANGDYVFTVSKDSILSDLEEAWSNENYDLVDVKIERISVDSLDFYVLAAHNLDYSVNTAIEIKYDSAANSFRIKNDNNLADPGIWHIACSSSCQFG
jgi:hypothetical protein